MSSATGYPLPGTPLYIPYPPYIVNILYVGGVYTYREMSGILIIESDIEKWAFWIKKDVEGLFLCYKEEEG